MGSAVVQEVMSRAVDFVVGKLEEKASKGHIIERLEMAHTELELALERSSKLPITDRSLLRRRKILKRFYEECGNVLDRCKPPALEDQENEQGVTRFSFPKRIAGLGRQSRNKGLLGYSDVGRFERYAAWADKFMRDLESGYSLRQYMFSNPLIRRLLQGTALWYYRMVQGSQEQTLCIWPMNFAERGVEACLLFSNTDLKIPEKRFIVFLVLRLSESTNILGITIKCLQLLLMPQIKSAVEAAMEELAQLPTQDIFDTYASSRLWPCDDHAIVHSWRPNPECCKADGHGTAAPYKIPEEVILFLLICPVTPYGCNLHSSPEKADKDGLPLTLAVIFAPHEIPWYQDLQEGDVAVECIEGTEKERIEHRNVSLNQVVEMVVPKAIDCFDHRPEVTEYAVWWQTPHGEAWFRVYNDGYRDAK